MRLAPIPIVDLCFHFFFLTCSVLQPSPPNVSTPLYPSPSFSILPRPLNHSSRSPPISVSVFLFSFYPPLQAHPLSSSIVPLPFFRHVQPTLAGSTPTSLLSSLSPQLPPSTPPFFVYRLFSPPQFFSPTYSYKRANVSLVVVFLSSPWSLGHTGMLMLCMS